MSIFTQTHFIFPYRDLHFPGQHSEEKILFICREGKAMLHLRLIALVLGVILLLLMRSIAGIFLQSVLPGLSSSFSIISLFFILAFGLLGWYWIYILWQKSIFIVTTRRLTKFIHTTPWNRYQLSLGLDKIVDTGSYQKGFIQGLFHLGYFVARSSAGNIKNFKIINIHYAEDLQNYINKLLFVFSKDISKLDTFRPFIPHLKGQAREDFINNTFPEYKKSA